MATIRDRTTLGALAGAGAILVRDAYSFLAKQIGFARFYVWGIAADLFLQGKAVQSAMGTVLGFLADLCTGALIGVVYAHFLRHAGGRNPVLKGLGFGLAAWLLLFGIIFHNLSHTMATAPKDPASNLSAFAGHSIFGLVLGYLWSKLLQRLAPRKRD
ncbi:MAG: hypothetical protein ACM3X6_05405 [Patescibacteria group bacterium]